MCLIDVSIFICSYSYHYMTIRISIFIRISPRSKIIIISSFILINFILLIIYFIYKYSIYWLNISSCCKNNKIF